MKSHNFVRATFVAAASLTVLLHVVGCSNPGTTTPSNGTGSRIAETDSRSNEYEDGTFTERYLRWRAVVHDHHGHAQ
ncbi:hypothetical protein [Rhodococcus erythropolis]